MKAKAHWIVFAYILLLTGSSLPIVHSNQHSSISDLENRLSRVADWIYAQYNPTLKLVKDSPIATANKTYWLLSANLLSSVALRYYYPEISQAIYLQLLEWGYTKDNLHEAIFGQVIPYPIRVVRNITIYQGYQGANYTIMTHMFDSQTVHNDYYTYFDFLVYLALSEFWKGNRVSATELFDIAYYSMWNGIGIWDKATNTTNEERPVPLYATYKLALLLYASRVMEIPLADREQIEERLWSMQQEEDGGIATEYYLNGTAATTKSNTETAPLVIIAYKYTPNLMPTNLVWLYVSLGVLSISILVVLILLLPKVHKSKLIKK
jgi:hypothetical protein